MFGAAAFTTPTKMDPFVDISFFVTGKDTYLTLLVVLNLLIVYIHFLVWTRLVDKNVKAKVNIFSVFVLQCVCYNIYLYV